MVLKREGNAAGFCSGVVVAPDAVLTAAHCAGALADTRVHFRDARGQPVLVELAAIAVHPLYRKSAIAAREQSIDLALLRTAQPLPAPFLPASLAASARIAVGDAFRLAGFGVAREKDGATSGTLRVAKLAARAPLSQILLWAQDAANQGAGACTGDSGAPIFAAGSDEVVAITDWASGNGGKSCGSLTQGALVGPQRSWIDETLRRWH